MIERKFDPRKKTVYILYENDGNHNILYDRNYNLDGCAIPFVYFKDEVEKAGYNFKPTYDYSGLANYNDVAYIVSFTLLNQQIFNSITKHPKEKCFLFIQEPPTTHGYLYDERLTQFFGKIFVMFDDLVDNKRYFKIYHPQRNEKMILDAPAFKDKKFCVMLQSNHFVQHPKSVYAERRAVCSFFDTKEGLDLYGARWEGYSSWRGGYRGKSKKDLIKNYKFTFAYENMHDQFGYITERIFDAFYAKTVPIYLGPKNINDYIPKECFINKSDFSSYEDLYHFMKNLDEKAYAAYLKQAEDFINSPKSECFSTRQFSKNIVNYMDVPFET